MQLFFSKRRTVRQIVRKFGLISGAVEKRKFIALMELQTAQVCLLLFVKALIIELNQLLMILKDTS